MGADQHRNERSRCEPGWMREFNEFNFEMMRSDIRQYVKMDSVHACAKNNTSLP